MLSGSRYCLRVNFKVASQLSADIILNRRLQFLYPRSFATQGQLNSDDISGHEALETNETPFDRRFSERRKSGRLDSGDSAKVYDALQQPSKNPSKAPATAFQSEHETTEHQKFQTILDQRRVRESLVQRKLRLNGRERRGYLAAPWSRSRKARPGRLSNRYLAFTQDPRWEMTLGMLANSKRRYKEVEGEEIWLSRSTLILLCGTPAANSWVHEMRGGCEVQVTDSRPSSGTSRHVLLRGSPQAVALTKEQFLSLEKTIEGQGEEHSGLTPIVLQNETVTRSEMGSPKTIAESNPSPRSDAVVPFRFVLARNRRSLKHEEYRLLDDSPSQHAYSVPSFLHCVEDLTTMKIPRLERRHVYGPRDERHNNVVANFLYRLFTEINTARFASALALDLALGFLGKHDELYHHTTTLYIQYRRSRLTLLPITYNHVLKAMFSQNDMMKFRDVLDDLCAEGHKPDCKIWLTLLKSESSMARKDIIVDWMGRRNLLGNALLRGQVAAEIVSAELRKIDDYNAYADRFIAATDARFGKDWMSGPPVAQILRACADLKAWAMAREIFMKAQERNVVFDATITSVILTVMQRRGSLRDSLDFFRSHFVRTVGRNDQALIPILFVTAWRHRFHNVCRVLWRYAAVRGVTTYKMENLVTESLLRNQDVAIPSTNSKDLTIATKEWWRRAGKVIVGTHLDTKGFEQFFNLIEQLPGSKATNPMLWLAQYVPEGEPRDQQLSLACVMLHRDLEAWKQFAPPSSQRLFKLLSDAYAMDVEWKGEGIGLDCVDKSTQWMIENAIEVPLVKREIPLRTRPAHPALQTTVNEDEQDSFPGQDGDVVHINC
jgi:pentatricopeptide repeat protein